MATGATLGDVGECIMRDSLFQGKDGKMDVDTFKRTFFPQYYQVDQEEERGNSDNENPPQSEKCETSVKLRLGKLEELIKVKLANNWVSVRKAFLDLDSDYDGFVTVDDILRVLGGEDKGMDYKDLTKLINDKD